MKVSFLVLLAFALNINSFYSITHAFSKNSTSLEASSDQLTEKTNIDLLDEKNDRLSKHNMQSTSTLAVNESDTFKVFAKNKWNDSGIRINAGEVYLISASGNWTDWFIDTDADGFCKVILQLVGFLRREPKENWFKLIGTIDRQKNYIIGNYQEITAKESGVLEFYANDISGFYFNNSGFLTVTVKRIS